MSFLVLTIANGVYIVCQDGLLDSIKRIIFRAVFRAFKYLVVAVSVGLMLLFSTCTKYEPMTKYYRSLNVSRVPFVAPCTLTDSMLNFTVLQQGYSSVEQDHSTSIASVSDTNISGGYGPAYKVTIVDSEQSTLNLYFKQKPIRGKYLMDFEYAVTLLEYDVVNVEFNKHPTSGGSNQDYEIPSGYREKDTLYVEYNDDGDLIMSFCELILNSGGTYWVPIEYSVSGNIVLPQ